MVPVITQKVLCANTVLIRALAEYKHMYLKIHRYIVLLAYPRSRGTHFSRSVFGMMLNRLSALSRNTLEQLFINTQTRPFIRAIAEHTFLLARFFLILPVYPRSRGIYVPELSSLLDSNRLSALSRNTPNRAILERLAAPFIRALAEHTPKVSA